MIPAHWNVLPHQPLVKLEHNLWTVQGSLPSPMPLSRRMTIVRLSGGKLLIHSPIALADDAMAAIEGWGEPAVLVVPNGHHRLDAPAFKERYPKIRVYCPRAVHERVSQVVTVTGHYDAMPADERVRVEPLSGTRNGEAAFVVNSDSGRTSLIFNDAVFNVPHRNDLPGLALRLLRTSGGPRVSPTAKLLMVRDRRALRRHLEQLADEPGLIRVIVSHGDVIESDESDESDKRNPREQLRRAASFL